MSWFYCASAQQSYAECNLHLCYLFHVALSYEYEWWWTVFILFILKDWMH